MNSFVVGLIAALAFSFNASAAISLNHDGRVQPSSVDTYGAAPNSQTGFASTTINSFLNYSLARTEYVSLNALDHADMSTAANISDYVLSISLGIIDAVGNPSVLLGAGIGQAGLDGGTFSDLSYHQSTIMNPMHFGHVTNLYSGYSSDQFSGFRQTQLYIAFVPEPETYAMLIAGLGLMVIVARRRQNQSHGCI